MFSYSVLLNSLAIFAYICNAQTVTISTKLGDITGSVQNTSWSTNVYLFAGIRYAVPPLNALRFRPAQIYTTKYDAIYDATKFASACIQTPSAKVPLNYSEDCLFLNIWTSNIKPIAKLLPVFLFIHGGSFVTGSGAMPLYNGNNIVGEIDGNIIYVSINYRLGSIGWLQNEQIYNEDNNWKSYGGMNGVYDQITSIQWVKNNIADYGGDPNKITIFGESAGALSICYLLISPIVPENLFQRAIIESGSCTGAWGTQYSVQEGLNQCNKALTTAGYPINNLTYLRSIDAQTFSTNVNCGVAVDGLIIDDKPDNIYYQLSQNNYSTFNAKDAVMIGWNSIDGLVSYPFYLGFAPKTDTDFNNAIKYYFPNSTQQSLMENVFYTPSQFKPQATANEYQIAWYSINADTCLGCPSLLMAQQIFDSKMTNNVYVYEFGGPTNHKSGMNYAPHTSELPFVFDWKQDDQYMAVPWSQSESNSMLSAWTNFALNGVPNVTNTIDKINIMWSPFSTDKQNVMVWDDTGKIVSDFSATHRNGSCQFLNQYNHDGFDINDICKDVSYP
eukprot:302510_1